MALPVLESRCRHQEALFGRLQDRVPAPRTVVLARVVAGKIQHDVITQRTASLVELGDGQ